MNRSIRSLAIVVVTVIPLLILIGCGATTSASTAGTTPITYDTNAATPIITVARVGGNLRGGTVFSLKGNGDLTYQDVTTFACMQGNINSAQIQTILHTIIDSDQFFHFTDGKTYGKPLNPDSAQTQIFVHANGQQRTVMVASANDADSTTLTNLVTYLQHVTAAHPQACA